MRNRFIKIRKVTVGVEAVGVFEQVRISCDSPMNTECQQLVSCVHSMSPNHHVLPNTTVPAGIKHPIRHGQLIDIIYESKVKPLYTSSLVTA